jgi:hypothetical protein
VRVISGLPKSNGTQAGSTIRARRQAGYADTARTLDRRPWDDEIDPMVGVAVHDPDAPGT